MPQNAIISIWGALIAGVTTVFMLLGGSSSGGVMANITLQLIASLLLGYTVTQLGTTPLSRSAKTLLAITICWIAWGAVQLVPLPPSIWTLAPGRDLLEHRLQMAGVPLPWLPLTLSVNGTIRHLTSLLPPLAIGALILIRSPEDSTGLRWVIPLVALVSLMVGVGQLLGGQNSPLYLYQTTNLGMSVGLMANANHQATLMLCAIPFVASLARGEARRSGQGRGRELLLLAMIVMLLIGIAISNSYAAFVLALPVVVASWVIARPRSLGPARYIAIGVGVVTLAALAAVLIVGPNALDSKASIGEIQLSRPMMYSVASKAALYFFPLGSGFGSFVPAFKLFEDPAQISNVFANHSHSDYLELALEGGLPGILLVMGLLVWWCRQAVTIWFARAPRRLDRAAVVATAAILAHSAVDYPARTTTIAVILAAGLALMTTRVVKVEAETAPTGGRHLKAE
ncbi:MAG: O-antigen ligase family protein [Sphingomonas sp.]